MFNIPLAFTKNTYAIPPVLMFELTTEPTLIEEGIPFVFFPLSLAPSLFWENVKSDGGDIRVYDPDDNRLPIEVDIDTTAQTGILHIKSSTWLDTTAAKTIKVYYGDSANNLEDSSSEFGSYNVYDASSVIYYNFRGSNKLKNRKQNNYHLTAVNTPLADQTTEFENLLSYKIQDTSSYLVYDDSTSAGDWPILTYPITLEVLSSMSNTTSDGLVTTISKKTAVSIPYFGARYRGDLTDDPIWATVAGDSGSQSNAASLVQTQVDKMNYISVTRNANTGTTYLYVDDTSYSNSTTLAAATFDTLGIGAAVRSSVSSPTQCKVAFVLISNTVRSANYYKTRFNNLYSSLFLKVSGATYYNTGFTLAGTSTAISSVNINWNNTGNILVDSTSVTNSDDLGEFEVTDVLRLTNFGFNLPSNAEVLGFVFKLRKKTNTTNHLKDYLIRPVLSGTNYGNNMKDPQFYTTSIITKEYGVAGYSWGTNFTYSDINNSTFGIDIQVTNLGSSTTAPAQLEAAFLDVYYRVWN